MEEEIWKFRLITTVEAVMKIAGNREAFIQEMNQRGYQVRWEKHRTVSGADTGPQSKKHRAMGEILSEMREEHKRDGRQRDEFTRELSEIRTTFQKDTQEAIASLRRWIPFIIMSSAAAAVPVCILMRQTLP